MNVEKLKEFRTNLAFAKGLCSLNKFDENIINPFLSARLGGKCVREAAFFFIPNDVFEWYTNPCRTVAERAAMWDNSIAAIDARIAKAK